MSTCTSISPVGMFGIDGLRRAAHDFALGLEHELVPDAVRDLCRLGRLVGVDDELHLAREVAQVDEDEPAVVAARVRPAGERDATAGVVRAQLAAHDVAPAHASSSCRCSTPSTATSSSPLRRSVQPSASTSTIARACFWPYEIWPLSERPAWSVSAESPAARSCRDRGDGRLRPAPTAKKTSSSGASAAMPSSSSEQDEPLDARRRSRCPASAARRSPRRGSRSGRRRRSWTPARSRPGR